VALARRQLQPQRADDLIDQRALQIEDVSPRDLRDVRLEQGSARRLKQLSVYL
jgi:hypothetical protein